MLAAMPQDEVESIVTKQNMVSFTPNTVTDLEALLADLEETQVRGFAIDNGEHEMGTYCVGAPILNHRGQVIGACSVSGQDPEIVGARLEELSRQVTYTALEISRRMGYVPAKISSLGTIGLHHAIPETE
jgi:DNA-binding IclR family transcriptional regulator